MSINISVTILGDKKTSEALAKLSTLDIPKVIKAGVADAARGGRTAISTNIRASYTLSAGRIKQDVSKPRFSDGGQTAIIHTNRRPITAMQYKARETRKGLSMSIYKGQRTVVRNGFIAKGLPFRREGKARYPLSVIHGPSIHGIYTGGRHATEIQQATEQRIEEQLVKGITRRINSLARGFG